jgi:hypothetical protein
MLRVLSYRRAVFNSYLPQFLLCYIVSVNDMTKNRNKYRPHISPLSVDFDKAR